MLRTSILIITTLLLTACEGSAKSSIWGKERGITGVWGNESEPHCSYYGNCDKAEPVNSCEIYGNCKE